eukprot:PhM_4_TR5036/c0_g1_i1/m.87778
MTAQEPHLPRLGAERRGLGAELLSEDKDVAEGDVLIDEEAVRLLAGPEGAVVQRVAHVGDVGLGALDCAVGGLLGLGHDAAVRRAVHVGDARPLCNVVDAVLELTQPFLFADDFNVEVFDALESGVACVLKSAQVVDGLDDAREGRLLLRVDALQFDVDAVEFLFAALDAVAAHFPGFGDFVPQRVGVDGLGARQLKESSESLRLDVKGVALGREEGVGLVKLLLRLLEVLHVLRTVLNGVLALPHDLVARVDGVLRVGARVERRPEAPDLLGEVVHRRVVLTKALLGVHIAPDRVERVSDGCEVSRPWRHWSLRHSLKYAVQRCVERLDAVQCVLDRQLQATASVDRELFDNAG